MIARTATSDDLPAVTALQRRWDEHWFGAPEHDEDEMGESFARIAPEQTQLVFDGDVLIGMAMRSDAESFLTTLDGAARGVLVKWLSTQRAGELDVFDRDTELRALLEQDGWRSRYSAFDLIRPVTADWTLAEPEWPDPVELRPLREQDWAALHRLIYRDAAWSDVPGHHDRTFEDWQRIFGTELADTDQQVLMWDADVLVGAATGRIWSDGTGWITQLAVARSQRGRGLGRALLLVAFRRRVAAGATALGLSVQASNEGALSLYLGVGLTVDREWCNYRR